MRIARTRTVSSMSAGWLRAARRIPLFLLSGLFLGTAIPAGADAQEVQQNRSIATDPHAAFVTEAARRFAIPEDWIRAVRHVESAENVRALSPAGAMGLMQIMPETWTDLRTRLGLGTDPYDARDNIIAGTAYLRDMYDRYGSPGFLAAYNAGPGRYEEYLAGRPLPAETRAYVAVLSPLVGGGELLPPMPGSAVVVANDPNAWRQSPLFVTPLLRRRDAERTATAPESGAAPTLPLAGDNPAPGTQSTGLFVARATEGDQK